MRIELTKLLNTMSTALDYVESELIISARNHGKRVAVLTNLMALEAGIEKEDVFILTQASVLHDCALSEYLKDEIKKDGKSLDEQMMKDHCSVGEKMLLKLPIYKRIEGTVLYHHERADGLGAFNKKASETPLCAQIVHTADLLDVKFNLSSFNRRKYEEMLKFLDEEKDKAISTKCVDLFKKAIDFDTLLSITGEGCRPILRKMLPPFMDEVSTDVLREMSSFFAKITDYKSHFTWRHSTGIAEKAEAMGKYYGYDSEMCDKLYISGALHDIGKLLISNDILEKPGKLTGDEYKEIQNHAMGTWTMLRNIGGLEDICHWAAFHHEKLDGTGYPFGYNAEKLDKNDRLLACLDIYQALVEVRPYKEGMPHFKAMEILYKMGNDNQLDLEIIKDVDNCFKTDEAIGETVDEETVEVKYEGEAWRCPVCGYVYEGNIPDDFICPRCEQPGTIFEKIN